MNHLLVGGVMSFAVITGELVSLWLGWSVHDDRASLVSGLAGVWTTV